MKLSKTMENEYYNGIAEDTRSQKKKEKDFNAKDLLVGSSKATFIPISSFNDIPLYQRRSQDGSGSCVAQSLAKLLEVIFRKNGFGDFKFSATPIYQKRSNKPESGMIGQNAMEIVTKFFTVLESMIISENMNDAQMDSLPVDLQELAKFTKNFLGDKKVSFTYFVDNTPSFDEMTQYIEKYGGAIFFVRTDYQNWCKDEPSYSMDDKRNIGHSTCGHFNALYNGKEVFINDESWGKYSTSEMGDRGQRIITKEFFDNRCFFVGVLVLNKYEDKKVDYSKYTSLPVLQYGDKKPEVQLLQQMLIEYGVFPSNIGKDNNFGPVTKKALLQWQLENLSTSKTLLNLWGGKYFGIASQKKIKELSLAGDNPPANIDMLKEISRSSDGSGNLSTTIKGLLVLLIPIIIAILKNKGINITESDIMSVIDTLIVLVGSIITVYGLVKKLYYNTIKK